MSISHPAQGHVSRTEKPKHKAQQQMRSTQTTELSWFGTELKLPDLPTARCVLYLL